MVYNLDKIDLKILKDINFDFRKSHAQIGKSTRIGKNTVYYRITNLEKNGILSDYNCFIDYGKLGYTYSRYFITLEKTSKKKYHDIIKRCSNIEDMAWFGLVSGTNARQLVAVFWTKNIQDANRKKYELVDCCEGHASKIEHSPAVSLEMFGNNFLFPEERSCKKIISDSHCYDISKNEQKLLSSLQKNPCQKIVELAENIGVSTKTTIALLKKLRENNIVVGFMAQLNYSAIGYQYIHVNFDIPCATKKTMKEIRTHITSQQSVAYIVESLGKYAFECEFVVSSMTDIHELIEELTFVFPEVAINAHIETINEVYKSH